MEKSGFSDFEKEAMRERALVHELAPELQAKTWYGMPAYANEEGKVVLFFKDASKFKSRYCTLGFEDAAQLDDAAMWPTSYALLAWNDAVAAQVENLILRAAGHAIK
ncbi:DUF1801 domain-containing protein [Weissella coleopterorum]|uniref:DUF1801 domain-containing protein n=1 Tax=Weissella coleopterorum TaxID=2714949 RepID=A0A6G8AYQ6_9LACO|nr:DUF1801 domain-containing protein [Weissella coleopterorum]QIL50013.1 DUF1801 domain-containing protein [Weissella coleopterorum]